MPTMTRPRPTVLRPRRTPPPPSPAPPPPPRAAQHRTPRGPPPGPGYPAPRPRGPPAPPPGRQLIPAPRSPRRDGTQGCLAGDVDPRMDIKLPQDVGDVGCDGPPGQQQPGGDLWVGQPALHERSDLGLGRREAVPPALRLPLFPMPAPPAALTAAPGRYPAH